MTDRVLKIAGRSLSLISWLDFEQSVEPIVGSTVHRMATGEGIKIAGWKKHRITLSAGGWIPAPLQGIDYSVPVEIELPLPLAFAVGEALPPGWVAVSETTVTDQAGSTVRLVIVRLTVLTDGPRLSHNNQANPAWEMTCEEK